jgi:dTDP-4-dehydrorhamnose reductase
MNILLFGSTGMLGRYVYNVLKNDYNVICIKRNDFDIENDEWSKLKNIITLNLKENDIILNCAGIIPQKYGNEYKKFIRINALFPHKLSEFANISNVKFIHITTDCVFNGFKGNYLETDEHNASNIYGISKSLGEPNEATIIRTSIIGEEIKDKKSLIEWVKSNKNQTIDGYTNHYWNGVTCLTLANIIKNIIDNNAFWKGVKHIYSPNCVSKYNLCCYINEIYNLNINIMPIETENKNLTLLSKEPPLFELNDIHSQIIEQKNYFKKKAFLIMTFTLHGWNSLLNCYNSIRKFDKNSIIIIVNNHNEDIHDSLKNENNVRYIRNIENNYELGAIKTGLYSYNDLDGYIVIQDSCEIINNIPDFNNDTIFFKTSIRDISPALDEVKMWCQEFFPEVVYNDMDNIMCQGLIGYFSRETLLKVFEYGLKNVNIQYKNQAVSSEGIFGILLVKINNNIDFYHKYKIDDYVTGKKNYEFIVKHIDGRGSSPEFDIMIINKNNKLHPTYKNIFIYKEKEYQSLLNCIESNLNEKEKVIFKYFHNNYENLLLLVDKAVSPR